MTRSRQIEQSRRDQLLAALLQGPATFYQICERAGIDIESQRSEDAARRCFDNLIGDYVRLVGVCYSLTAAGLAALGEKKPAPYAGEIAGPAYRGKPDPRTVFVTLRPVGVRA